MPFLSKSAFMEIFLYIHESQLPLLAKASLVMSTLDRQLHSWKYSRGLPFAGSHSVYQALKNCQPSKSPSSMYAGAEILSPKGRFVFARFGAR